MVVFVAVGVSVTRDSGLGFAVGLREERYAERKIEEEMKMRIKRIKNNNKEIIF